MHKSYIGTETSIFLFQNKINFIEVIRDKTIPIRMYHQAKSISVMDIYQ